MMVRAIHAKKITRSGDTSDRLLNLAPHALCDEAIAYRLVSCMRLEPRGSFARA
jgi:hypothetical protein